VKQSTPGESFQQPEKWLTVFRRMPDKVSVLNPPQRSWNLTTLIQDWNDAFLIVESDLEFTKNLSGSH